MLDIFRNIILLLASTIDVIFIIGLFIPLIGFHNDLSNWVVLLVSGTLLFIIPILISKETSKSISKTQKKLLHDLFRLNKFFQDKQIFEEKSKILPIHNRMRNTKEHIFMDELNGGTIGAVGIRHDVAIHKIVVEQYTNYLEEHYETLLSINEITAGRVRHLIKKQLQVINKVERNAFGFYIFKDGDIFWINNWGSIDDAFDRFEKTLKGYGGGFPKDLLDELHIDLMDSLKK